MEDRIALLQVFSCLLLLLPLGAGALLVVSGRRLGPWPVTAGTESTAADPAVVSRAAAGQAGRPVLSAPRTPYYYLLAAIVFTAIAVCGSLAPFDFRPLPLAEAADQFGHSMDLGLARPSRSDWLSNILLFVPLGYLWLATLIGRPTHRLQNAGAVLGTVLGCVALSGAIEFVQVWLPQRTVSPSDIIAEGLGSLMGAALWLATGQLVTDYCEAVGARTRQARPVDWLLEAWLVGLCVYSLLPLDVTIRPVELRGKYRDGRLLLIPFSDLTSPEVLLAALLGMLTFLPVGMLAATCLTVPQRPVRSLPRSLIAGLLIVVAIEISQVFIGSRTANGLDVVTGLAGIVLGVITVRFTAHWLWPPETHA